MRRSRLIPTFVALREGTLCWHQLAWKLGSGRRRGNGLSVLRHCDIRRRTCHANGKGRAKTCTTSMLDFQRTGDLRAHLGIIEARLPGIGVDVDQKC